MSELQTAMASAIKVRLTRLGMTQETLAGRVGMSPQSLSARLTGRTLFDTGDLDRFATALNLDNGFDLIDLARVEHVRAAA